MLEIQNLTLRLGQKIIVSDVSLRVARGQMCAVLGPNGGGKSTLLRALAGLLPPANGAILWEGAPLESGRARARQVAFLPQHFGGDDQLTTREMALLGRTPHLQNYGAPSKKDREIAENAVARVAPDLENRILGELSGGERQRALLPRVLATQAPILLLDEPISALDVRFQHEILGLVRRETRQSNLVTLCALHGLNLAALVADVMLLLDENGRVAASGSVFEVMQAPILSAVYGLPMRVSPHPQNGKPQAQSFWEFED